MVRVRGVRPNPSILGEGFSNPSIFKGEDRKDRNSKVYLVAFYRGVVSVGAVGAFAPTVFEKSENDT